MTLYETDTNFAVFCFDLLFPFHGFLVNVLNGSIFFQVQKKF